MRRLSPSFFASLLSVLVGALPVAGCGGASVQPGDGANDGDSSSVNDAANSPDTAEPDTASTPDNGVVTSPDTGSSDVLSTIDTGGSDTPAPDCSLPAPERLACLTDEALGTALPISAFGALECELVAVLPPGGSYKGCANDDAHVHLQVVANGERYDIAIDDGEADGEMFFYAKTLPATAPAEGWSTTPFTYTTDLGVKSTDFTEMTPSDLSAKLVSLLANVSTLTIHGMSYTDGTGVHDVHYESGKGHDGVLLLHGQGDGCGDLAVALHFVSDTF